MLCRNRSFSLEQQQSGAASKCNMGRPLHEPVPRRRHFPRFGLGYPDVYCLLCRADDFALFHYRHRYDNALPPIAHLPPNRRNKRIGIKKSFFPQRKKLFQYAAIFLIFPTALQRSDKRRNPQTLCKRRSIPRLCRSPRVCCLNRRQQRRHLFWHRFLPFPLPYRHGFSFLHTHV